PSGESSRAGDAATFTPPHTTSGRWYPLGTPVEPCRLRDVVQQGSIVGNSAAPIRAALGEVAWVGCPGLWPSSAGSVGSRAVRARAGEQASVGAERQGAGVGGVSPPGAERFPRGRIPDRKLAKPPRRSDKPVRAEGQGRQTERRGPKGEEFSPGRGVPQLDLR